MSNSSLPTGWTRSFEGNSVIWKMTSKWARFYEGQQSLHLSKNRLESRLCWFGWSRKKVYQDATLRLEAFFDDAQDPKAHVWKWFLTAHGAHGKELLFLATLGYLNMDIPETMLAELSRLTGWPAETSYTYEAQPPPFSSFNGAG